MAEVWEYCRKMGNGARLELLRLVYVSKYGLNVTLAEDKSKLGQSGVSQYLIQLEALGLVRRERSGRFVNYHPELHSGQIVAREIVPLLMERFRGSRRPGLAFASVFPALMNPLRARIVARLAKEGRMTSEEICDKFAIQPRHLSRRMSPIAECGLAEIDEDGYAYVEPVDPIVRKLVSLI